MCIILVIPKIENNWFRQWVTVLLVISLHGKANGKQENLSITITKYLFTSTDDGKGSLKSIFTCWNGSIAFIILLLFLSFLCHWL